MALVVPDGAGVWARRLAAEEEGEEATVVRRRRRGVAGEEELSLSGGRRHAPHPTRNKILFVLLGRAAPGPCVCLLLCTGHRCCRPAGPFLLFLPSVFFLPFYLSFYGTIFCFLAWRK